MPNAYRLLLDNDPADDALYTVMGPLEVEENADLPGAFQLTLPVDRSAEGDLTLVADARFKPFANIAVVATPDDGDPQCIFDGYVLAHKLHLQTGVTASTLQVWGQDASWLMNLEEKARIWPDVTDADVAASIFGEYGFKPDPANRDDDSPAHLESGHALVQRGTDIQFLRRLAKRSGKLCRVVCAGEPGQYTGVFASPQLEGDPVVVIRLNDPEAWSVQALDIEWDVTRPSAVQARTVLPADNSPVGVGVELDDSGLELLDERGLADFAGRPNQVLLAAAVDEAGELNLRAQALLRDAAWFVRCQGEADVARLGVVLRAGTVVQLDGIGSLHLGKYYVWSVRHTISANSHLMKFTLLRNAVGPAPSGGGLFGGLL